MASPPRAVSGRGVRGGAVRLLVAVLTITLGLGGISAAPAAEPSPGWERYREEGDRALADLEREMRTLEKRFDKELERRRALARRRLAELRTRAERTWRRLRPELEQELRELRRAFEAPGPEPTRT